MRASAVNPLSGRRLPGLLTASGLVVDDIGSRALVQPADAATGPLTTMLGAMAVERGLLTPVQRDEFLADLSAAAERGDFLMSVTMFAVLVHRA